MSSKALLWLSLIIIVVAAVLWILTPDNSTKTNGTTINAASTNATMTTNLNDNKNANATVNE